MGETSSLFKRLIGAWNDIAGSVTSSTGVSPDLSSQDDADSVRDQMVACLEGQTRKRRCARPWSRHAYA